MSRTDVGDVEMDVVHHQNDLNDPNETSSTMSDNGNDSSGEYRTELR
jgi:hypothetical protein